jgi:hypothetical protein
MSTFNRSILEAALVGLEAQKKRIDTRFAAGAWPGGRFRPG